MTLDRAAWDREMKLRMARNSTRMDKQGRVFLHRDTVKMLGLTGGGAVEFYLTAEGLCALRKVTKRR